MCKMRNVWWKCCRCAIHQKDRENEDTERNREEVKKKKGKEKGTETEKRIEAIFACHFRARSIV